MSWSHGTGSPVFFRCFRCRRDRPSECAGWHEAKGGRHRRNLCGSSIRVILTGKQRDRRRGAGSAVGHRSDLVDREYVCECCEHRGWSNHKDLGVFAVPAEGGGV